MDGAPWHGARTRHSGDYCDHEQRSSGAPDALGPYRFGCYGPLAMRIVSWNVNGLRACVKKGFARFLDDSAADVVGVQEVRALPEQIDRESCIPSGWHACFAPA